MRWIDSSRSSALVIAAAAVVAMPAQGQIFARGAPLQTKARKSNGSVTNALPGCGGGVPAAPFTSPPPPERKKLGSSPGGVDMRSGAFNFQNIDVSIGGEGDAGLALSRSFSWNGDTKKFPQSFGEFFTHNWDIQIQERRLPRAGDCYPSQFAYSETVAYGDLGDNFVKSGNVGIFEQTGSFGYAEIAYTSAGTVPNNFVFTARDGTIVRFMPIGNGVCPGAQGRCGYATSVARPDGTLFTLEYETITGTNGVRLRSVVSNRGYALLFEYGGSVQPTKICALNLAFMTKPANNVCPSDVSTASYTYDGAVQTSATEAGGGTWLFGRPTASSFSITMPGAGQPYVTNAYSFVQGGNDIEKAFVVDSQQMASGEHYSYAWNILRNEDYQGSSSDQVLGGSWTDTQGHGVSVIYGAYYRDIPQGESAPVYYGTPGPERVVDELGRTTVYNYCGATADGGQCYIPPLQSVTEPEGNREIISYGPYNNPGGVRKIAKPSSGLADIVESRDYGNNTNPVSRAKPASITDARGGVTNFTYDPVHGGTTSESAPANAAGIRAVKRYGYTQRTAGLSTGPAATPVWLLTMEKSCRTSATTGLSITDGCAAGVADEVVTTYDYGPTNGPNNLLLRGKTVTADWVTLRTCYGYDAQGNRISETTPNAGLAVCS